MTFLAQIFDIEFPGSNFNFSVVRGTTYLRCGTVVNQGTYAVPALTMPQSHDADAVADDGAAPPAPMTMTSCPGSFGNWFRFQFAMAALHRTWNAKSQNQATNRPAGWMTNKQTNVF